MDCVGVDSVGCQFNEMGGWLGNFLDVAGNPIGSFLFLIMVTAFIVLTFLAIKQIFS